MATSWTCEVYAAVNRLNGNLYIGATRIGVGSRKDRHLKLARDGGKGYFHSAIRKYGPENFAFFTLHQVRTFEEALALEKRMITKYSPEYNLTAGGEGVLNYKFGPESKERMRQAKLGKKLSLEHANKIRFANLGRKFPAKTKEERERRTEAVKKAVAARRRVVVCEQDGLEFIGIIEAAEFYGIGYKHVYHACHGRGYKWIVKQQGLSFKFKEKK